MDINALEKNLASVKVRFQEATASVKDRMERTRDIRMAETAELNESKVDLTAELQRLHDDESMLRERTNTCIFETY